MKPKPNTMVTCQGRGCGIGDIGDNAETLLLSCTREEREGVAGVAVCDLHCRASFQVYYPALLLTSSLSLAKGTY